MNSDVGVLAGDLNSSGSRFRKVVNIKASALSQCCTLGPPGVSRHCFCVKHHTTPARRQAYYCLGFLVRTPFVQHSFLVKALSPLD